MTCILVPYHLDEHLPDLDVPYEPDRKVTADLPDGSPWQRLAALYGNAADVVAEDARAGGRPVVMSGDCTTSLATVAGLQRAGVDPPRQNREPRPGLTTGTRGNRSRESGPLSE
jgi:arginase